MSHKPKHAVPRDITCGTLALWYLIAALVVFVIAVLV